MPDILVLLYFLLPYISHLILRDKTTPKITLYQNNLFDKFAKENKFKYKMKISTYKKIICSFVQKLWCNTYRGCNSRNKASYNS